MKNSTETKSITNNRKLTTPQTDLLKLLYKFRYATIPLLAAHKHKNKATSYRTLQTLVKSEYVDSNYSPAYCLAGRGAEYYLARKGLSYMRDNYTLSKDVLHAMYRNNALSQPFIQKCLLIYKVYIQLQKQYGSQLVILTQSENADADGFPKPHPDLFMQSDTHDYLLDIFTDNRFFLIKKRIDQLIQHYEDGDWLEQTHPILLLVLPNSSLESRALAYIESAKDNAFIEDGELVILTTTMKALLDPNTNNAIWSKSIDGEKASELFIL